MAPQIQKKRKLVRFALDNEHEHAAGRTAPLAEQPYARSPALGSWSTLAAWSEQLLTNLAKWSGWSLLQHRMAVDELHDDLGGYCAGVDCPGAWPDAYPRVTTCSTYGLEYDYDDPPATAAPGNDVEMKDVEMAPSPPAKDVETTSPPSASPPPASQAAIAAPETNVEITPLPASQTAPSRRKKQEAIAKSRQTRQRRQQPSSKLCFQKPPSAVALFGPNLGLMANTAEFLELNQKFRKINIFDRAREIRSKAKKERAQDDGEIQIQAQDNARKQRKVEERRNRRSAFTKSPEDYVAEAYRLAKNTREYEVLLKYERIARFKREEYEELHAAKKLQESEAQAKKEEEERAARAAQRIVQEVAPEYQPKIAKIMQSKDMGMDADGVGRLSRGDLGTLLPQAGIDRELGWLNDNVINEYLAKVVADELKQQSYKKKTGKVPRVHAFGSQFFKTWTSKGFDGVKRWLERAEINGAKLLQVKMMLIPICSGNHWTLMAVSGTNKTIQYFNSMDGFGSGRVYVDKVKEMLANQLGEKYVEDEWTVLPNDESSQQINSSDCGVFTAFNGHALLTRREPRLVFSMDNKKEISEARNYMAAVLIGQPL